MSLACVLSLLASDTPVLASVVFRLDYLNSTFVPPWTGIQAQATDRTQLVADPAGGNYVVGRFEVQDGDFVSSGERAEVLYRPGAPGAGTEDVNEENYYAFSTYFPAGYATTGQWGIFTQFHSDGLAASPVLAFETRPTGSSQLRLVVRGGPIAGITTQTFDPASMTISPGQWHDFVFFMKRRTDSTGNVKLWHRLQGSNFEQLVDYNGPNMYIDGATTKPAYIKQGIYRHPDSTGTNTLFHKGIWKTTSYESALSYFATPSEFAASNLSSSVASYISATTNTTVNVNLTPTSSGVTSSASDTVSVSTNDAAGYNLSLANTNTDTDLQNGANEIPAHSGTQASPTNLAANTWGYRVDSLGGFGAGPTNSESNVGSSAYSWAGVPSSASPSTIKTTSAPAQNSQTVVWYGVRVNLAKPSGTYTDTVTYTATTNP